MKKTRYIFVAFVMMVSIFAALTYLACKKDKCNNVVCHNGGACNNGSCICLPGYEGTNCEILSRDKFITTFNGGDTCTDSNSHPDYGIELLAVPSNNIQLTMVNLLNNPHDSAVCTMITPDSFYFQGSYNSTTYYGGGKMSNDSLWLNYHVQQDTIPYNCTFFGIRY